MGPLVVDRVRPEAAFAGVVKGLDTGARISVQQARNLTATSRTIHTTERQATQSLPHAAWLGGGTQSAKRA